MNELKLRPLIPADRDFLFRLYASTRIQEMNSVDWPPEQIQDFLRMQFKLQDRHYREYYPHAAWYIICCDSQPIGRLYLQRNDAEIRIIDISLLPEWRGQGIGSWLFKELIRESEEKLLPLSLHVESGNPIRAFYQRLGFQTCELRGVYYYMERPPHTASECSTRRSTRTNSAFKNFTA